VKLKRRFAAAFELLASWQSIPKAALSGCPAFQRIKDRGWALGRYAMHLSLIMPNPRHATVATLPKFSLAAL
jgi:hypothetical protein